MPRHRLIFALLGLAVLVSVPALMGVRGSGSRVRIELSPEAKGQQTQSALSPWTSASAPLPAASSDATMPPVHRLAKAELPASKSLAARFPRGLTEHASLVLQQHDGAGAMAVAQALAACGRLRVVLPGAELALRSNTTPAAYARNAQDLAEQQQLVALCQTATPELQNQRRALYALAAQQEVPGAASAYYDARDPESQTASIVRQVRADAERGQLMALGALAESPAKAGVLTEDEVAAYRLALTLLAKTPEWGSSAAGVMSFIRQDRAFHRAMAAAARGDAQQVAVAMDAGDEDGELYDLSRLSPQARQKATLLVQRLVAHGR